MILAMTFWGANWTSAKLLGSTMPADILIFYRFLFSAVLFLPLLLFKKISLKVPVSLWGILGVCVVLMGVYQWLFFKGVLVGFAGAGGVLVTTLNPILTFVFVSVLTRKKLSIREWMGLSLGLISGFFFLHLWNFSLDQFLHSGTVYFVCAAVCWSTLSVLSTRIKLHPMAYNFYLFSLILPFMLLNLPGSQLGLILNQGPSFWLNMTNMVLFGTVFATTLYFHVNQTLGSKVAASFILLVPLSTALVAYLVLHEVITWTTLVGGTLALSGLIVLNRSAS